MIKTHKEKQSLPRAFYLLWSTVDSWLHHHSFREKKTVLPHTARKPKPMHILPSGKHTKSY